MIAVLVMVLILAITAIVVPISMYALNDTKSSGTSTTSIVPATTILATTTLATTTGKPLKRRGILFIRILFLQVTERQLFFWTAGLLNNLSY